MILLVLISWMIFCVVSLAVDWAIYLAPLGSFSLVNVLAWVNLLLADSNGVMVVLTSLPLRLSDLKSRSSGCFVEV